MSAITEALSAALVHFIWQGALVGLLLWTTLFALRNRSSNDRYAASAAALALLAALPVVTTVVLHGWVLPTIGTRTFSSGGNPRSVIDAYQPFASKWSRANLPPTEWLAVLQLWALPVWSMGVLLFSLRLVSGGMHVFVCGRRAGAADACLRDKVAKIADRMGVDRPVRVLISTLADGPGVIGWLRPIVLLPPATAMGLTPQQLEAVLAHELAHIRRHDYLVNILQMMVETVLFYHPVVWWTSRRIRFERELCCDDLAVASCGDALTYARALTTLETLRVTKPTLAVGSTGGPLLYRIHRLMNASTREYGPSRWPGALLLCLGLVCAALNMNWVRAQTQTSPVTRLAFEAASVKPNTSGPGLVNIGTRAGRFTATNVTLRMLLKNAYGLQDFQMSGGPSWIDSDRFDLVSKADGNATFDEVRLMVRTLLEDRFKLNAHTETRTLPVYAMVIARSDGRVGGELRKAGNECRPVTLWPGAPPPPPPPPGPPIGGRTQCPSMLVQGNVSARDLTMERLAGLLSSWVNRFVLDRTALSGSFDFDLHWAPDRRPVAFNNLPPSPVPVDPDGPSLFTALREQLGLKLDSQRRPVDILVIDHVERPAED
jgi:uncharacterized protein (TIGR03435 family)